MIFALMITPLFAILAIGDVPSALSMIEIEAPGKLDMFKGLVLSPLFPFSGGDWAISGNRTFWCVSWQPIPSNPFPKPVVSVLPG